MTIKNLTERDSTAEVESMKKVSMSVKGYKGNRPRSLLVYGHNSSLGMLEGVEKSL